MAGVRETLELETSAAFRAVEQLGRALSQAAQGFSVGLSQAIENVSGQSIEVDADASDVTSSIETAVDVADDEAEVEGEASDVTSAIEGAVDAADDEVAVEGEASDVTAAIDTAVDVADDDVSIEGEASDVTSAIDAAVEAADDDVEITADAGAVTGAIDGAVLAADTDVEVDVGDAIGSVDDLATSALGAGIALGAAGDQGAEANAAIDSSSVGAAAGVAAVSKGAAGLGTVAKFSIAGVGVAALGAFGLSSIRAASDLQESVTLATAVFGDSADEIFEFGETSANAIGLAESSALQFASNLGGLLIGLGGTREEAAALSIELLIMASDLASAKNLAGGTEEALLRLQSGLVGEIEPLRRLGVSFNAVDVEQEAVKLGLGDLNGVISEGEKVTARYSLIVASLGSQGVLGDFARTQDDLANRTRRVNATWEDAQAVLGKALLPVAERFAEVIQEDVIPAVIELAPAFGGLAELALPLVELLGLIARGTSDVGSAFRAEQSAIDEFTQAGKDFIQTVASVFPGIEAPVQDSLQIVGKAFVGAQEPIEEVEEDLESVADAAEQMAIDTAAAVDETLGVFEDFNDDAKVSLGEFVFGLALVTQENERFFGAIEELVARGATTLAAFFLAQGTGALDAAEEAAGASDSTLTSIDETVQGYADQNTNVEGLLLDFKGAVGTISEQAGAAGAAGFGEGIDPISFRAAEALANARAEIAGARVAAATAGEGVGESATTGLKIGLVPMPGASREAVDRAIEAVERRQARAERSGRGLGTETVTGLRLGLNPMQARAKEAATRAIDAVFAAQDRATRGGERIGGNLTRGVIAGIAANISAVITAARTIIDTALAAARRAAEEQSPSELFAREIGEPISEGIAVGILRGAGTVEESIARTIAGATTSPVVGVNLPTAGAAAAGGLTIPSFTVTVNVPAGSTPEQMREAGQAVGDGILDSAERRAVVVDSILGG